MLSMNKFKFYFIVASLSVLFFSCQEDEPGIPSEPARDYQVQYNTESKDIEDFLKSHYITEPENKPGTREDQNVTISKIDKNQASIWSLKDATTFPKLTYRDIVIHNVTYKIYYLILREGVGDSPTNVDAVLAAYKGSYLSKTVATADKPAEFTTTVFEESVFPQQNLSLLTVIKGWSEIFPQFKTGTRKDGGIGPDIYENFGAGVMFIPSGLAYYNQGSIGIPSYSPLFFSFKLYEIERLDQDRDGILSFREDLNNDGYIYDYRNTIYFPTKPTAANLDDTDKDDIPDYLDDDDDGDRYITNLEITMPDKKTLYPFDEIPFCPNSNKKRHLDATCFQ